jgi:hypothetical protein
VNELAAIMAPPRRQAFNALLVLQVQLVLAEVFANSLFFACAATEALKLRTHVGMDPRMRRAMVYAIVFEPKWQSNDL